MPTVKLSWLKACATEGELQDYTPYLAVQKLSSSPPPQPPKPALSNMLSNALIYIFQGASSNDVFLEVKRSAIRLGAELADSVCLGVSHCIHVADPACGGGGDESDRPSLERLEREAEEAEGVGAMFVSADWLTACEQAAERVSETTFVIQSPLKAGLLSSQSTGGSQLYLHQQQQQQVTTPQRPTHKALSTPLTTIKAQNNNNIDESGAGKTVNNNNNNNTNALFFPTQPQRTYSRKRSGKRSAVAAISAVDPPAYIFHQNEQLLNELSGKPIQQRQPQQQQQQQQQQISYDESEANRRRRRSGNDNSNETTAGNDGGGADAELLKCLSGLRGLQAKDSNKSANRRSDSNNINNNNSEGNNISGNNNGNNNNNNNNNKEALPITRSGNKHKHTRRSGNTERRAHKPRLSVDPFSDSCSGTGTAAAAAATITTSSSVAGGGGVMLMAMMDGESVYGSGNSSGNNTINNGAGVGVGADSGNESEELFENPSQIIAYAPDADQRKREDLRRRLQNAK